MLRPLVILLSLALPAAAEHPPGPPLLPFHEVMRLVADRYRGRVLAARLDRAEPLEYAMGVDLVQELTLLTPARNIIRIRLDAVTGQVLKLRGRGIVDAHRPASPASRRAGTQGAAGQDGRTGHK